MTTDGLLDGPYPQEGFLFLLGFMGFGLFLGVMSMCCGGWYLFRHRIHKRLVSAATMKMYPNGGWPSQIPPRREHGGRTDRVETQFVAFFSDPVVHTLAIPAVQLLISFGTFIFWSNHGGYTAGSAAFWTLIAVNVAQVMLMLHSAAAMSRDLGAWCDMCKGYGASLFMGGALFLGVAALALLFGAFWISTAAEPVLRDNSHFWTSLGLVVVCAIVLLHLIGFFSNFVYMAYEQSDHPLDDMVTPGLDYYLYHSPQDTMFPNGQVALTHPATVLSENFLADTLSGEGISAAGTTSATYIAHLENALREAKSKTQTNPAAAMLGAGQTLVHRMQAGFGQSCHPQAPVGAMRVGDFPRANV
jgi:hypothetical protein